MDRIKLRNPANLRSDRDETCKEVLVQPLPHQPFFAFSVPLWAGRYLASERVVGLIGAANFWSWIWWS